MQAPCWKGRGNHRVSRNFQNLPGEGPVLRRRVFHARNVPGGHGSNLMQAYGD